MQCAKRDRNTPPSHLLLPFHLLLCHPATHTSLALLPSVLSPLSISPPLPSISPDSPTSSLSPSLPLSVEKTGAGIVHLRVMELWQADPSALSPGRAAVPGLCDAYFPPKHTSTQKWQEYTHLHTCMHTFIDATEGACALTHTSTLWCTCACSCMCYHIHYRLHSRYTSERNDVMWWENHSLHDFYLLAWCQNQY